MLLPNIYKISLQENLPLWQIVLILEIKLGKPSGLYFTLGLSWHQYSRGMHSHGFYFMKGDLVCPKRCPLWHQEEISLRASGVEQCDAPWARFSDYQWSGKRLLTRTRLAWDAWANTARINGMLLAQQPLLQAPCKLPGLVFGWQPAHIIAVPGAVAADTHCARTNEGARSAKGECQVSPASRGQAGLLQPALLSLVPAALSSGQQHRWAPSLRSNAWDPGW